VLLRGQRNSGEGRGQKQPSALRAEVVLSDTRVLNSDSLRSDTDNETRTNTKGRQIAGLYSDRNLHAEPHSVLVRLYDDSQSRRQ
jgi:hypothetical protein